MSQLSESYQSPASLQALNMDLSTQQAVLYLVMPWLLHHHAVHLVPTHHCPGGDQVKEVFIEVINDIFVIIVGLIKNICVYSKYSNKSSASLLYSISK